MVAVGVLYLIFQRKLLAKSALKGDSTAPANDNVSRALVGIQVNHLTMAHDTTANSARLG